MHTKFKLAVIVILSFVVLANCKKSKSSPAPVVNDSIDTNMAGMRTWQQMQVDGSVDSIGTRHYDTTYTTLRTQIKPISATMVLLYGDSAAVYADTLMAVPSNATGVMSFIKAGTGISIFASDTTVTTTYDSVAFNYYGVYSMLWYHLNTQLSNTIKDSTYTISHTP